jgi:Tfp pilus assembly protein PilN
MEMSRLLPSEIVLTSFAFQKDDKVTIKGQAQEMSDIFKFITTLESSSYFKDVQARYTTRKKIKGKDVNEFELICPIESAQSAKSAKTAEKKEPKKAAAAAKKENEL